MDEFDNQTSGAGVDEKPVSAGYKKPRIALIIVSAIFFAYAIYATVLVWDGASHPGAMAVISSVLAIPGLVLSAIEPALKGKKYRIAVLLLSIVSVALCVVAIPLGFAWAFTESCVLLSVSTGFSGLFCASIILCAVLAKLKPSNEDASESHLADGMPLDVNAQDVSPVCSKEKAVLLTATYNKGIGLWTSVCQGFANIFGCKCKHYDRKVNMALSKIKESLLKEMSSYPDFDFGAFHIASDGRLSFTGSVIGVKRKKED